MLVWVVFFSFSIFFISFSAFSVVACSVMEAYECHIEGADSCLTAARHYIIIQGQCRSRNEFFFSLSLFFSMSRLSLFLFDLHFNTVEVTIKCSVSGHPSTNSMPLVTCMDQIILYHYSYEVCYSESLIVVSLAGSVIVQRLK